MPIITGQKILASDIITLQNKIVELENKLINVQSTTSNLAEYFTPNYSAGVWLLNNPSINYVVPSNGVILVRASGNRRLVKVIINGKEVAYDERDHNYWSDDIFELRVIKNDRVEIITERSPQSAWFYPYRKQ